MRAPEFRNCLLMLLKSHAGNADTIAAVTPQRSDPHAPRPPSSGPARSMANFACLPEARPLHPVERTPLPRAGTSARDPQRTFRVAAATFRRSQDRCQAGGRRLGGVLTYRGGLSLALLFIPCDFRKGSCAEMLSWSKSRPQYIRRLSLPVSIDARPRSN
jgi:hypothetical protein